jgi:hypothetical protein
MSLYSFFQFFKQASGMLKLLTRKFDTVGGSSILKNCQLTQKGANVEQHVCFFVKDAEIS